MIRVTITRKPVGYANKRNRHVQQGCHMQVFADNIPAAKAELSALNAAGAFDGLYAFGDAKFYDAEAFKADPFRCKPVLVLTAINW